MRALFVASLKSPHKRSLLIGGSKQEGKNYLSSQLQNPRSIAVDPTIGIMIWTSWPDGAPASFEMTEGIESKEKNKKNLGGGKLEAAWLDGTHRLIY